MNMTKRELRQQIRQQKGHFGKETLCEMSLPIVRRLLDQPAVRHAQVVMAYASLPDEVQTDTLLADLLAAGKTVLLPKVVDGEEMEVRQYTGANDLAEGAFHIMEPVGPRFTTLEHIAVVIVPGMAFDAAGHRLGRGRGYYDRFLQQLPPSTLKIGVCYPFQMMDSVPSEPHDVVMDTVAC